jgi:hypothetical protein
MAGKYEDKVMVDVFIGVQKFTMPDGKVKSKNVYGRISTATANFIGVPNELRKTGSNTKVTISKGKGKGATYERPIRGSRGDTFKLVYPATGTQAGATRKLVSIGVPAGTNCTTFSNFVKKLTKKPQSVIYPSGKTHKRSEYGAVR